jgi:hypothetical protein
MAGAVEVTVVGCAFRATIAGRRTVQKAGVAMVGILWTIVVILVILWLIGLVAHIAGGLIYILLVIAVIIAIFNLLTGRRGV